MLSECKQSNSPNVPNTVAECSPEGDNAYKCTYKCDDKDNKFPGETITCDVTSGNWPYPTKAREKCKIDEEFTTGSTKGESLQ